MSENAAPLVLFLEQVFKSFKELDFTMPFWYLLRCLTTGIVREQKKTEKTVIALFSSCSENGCEVCLKTTPATSTLACLANSYLPLPPLRGVLRAARVIVLPSF